MIKLTNYKNTTHIVVLCKIFLKKIIEIYIYIKYINIILNYYIVFKVYCKTSYKNFINKNFLLIKYKNYLK